MHLTVFYSFLFFKFHTYKLIFSDIFALFLAPNKVFTVQKKSTFRMSVLLPLSASVGRFRVSRMQDFVTTICVNAGQNRGEKLI